MAHGERAAQQIERVGELCIEGMQPLLALPGNMQNGNGRRDEA